VGRSFGGVSKKSCRFDHDLNPGVSPGDVCRISFGDGFNRLAVYDDGSITRLDLAGIAAIVGVILQKVRIGLGIGKVIDHHHFEFVAMTFVDCLEDLATDSPESVDAHFDCHQ